MTIGTVVTKQLLDAQMGTVAANLAKVMREIDELHQYLLATPDATLTGLGYTTAEVATVKSAFTDGNLLDQIYQGAVNLPSAQDFRLNLMQLAGTRVTD